MINTTFAELFGGYLESFSKELGDGAITECSIDQETRIMSADLSFNTYIKRSNLDAAADTLRAVLMLSGVVFNAVFLPQCFCEAACEDISAKLKGETCQINGFLEGAKYTIDGDNLKIELMHGGIDTLKKTEFAKRFSAAAKEWFSRKVNVEFCGVTERDEIEQQYIVNEPPKAFAMTSADFGGAHPAAPSAAKPQAHKPTVQKAEREKTAAPRPLPPKAEIDTTVPPEDGLPVYLNSARLFFGKKINTNVKRLIDVMPLDDMNATSDFVGWGEVSGLEVRDINTQRGPRKGVNFCFSDYTNSIKAKMFLNPEQFEELSLLKNGACVVVNGIYKFDSWSKEFIVDVKALAELQKYRKTDKHEGLRRVELHCHTNMSAKDAVSSGDSIVEQAFKWGHKAVAITDHGVVQAYPAAAAAVKKIKKGGGDFKVIYGVESYFVNDELNDIDNMTPKEAAKHRYHQIILVKNLTGLKNLYKLVSKAHLEDFKGRPLTKKTNIDKYREGLILGSACEAGELYRAVVDGAPHDELIRIASYYDYLEIQPLGNNEFMVRDSVKPDKVEKNGNVIPNRLRHVTSLEVIKDFNRKIVEIADELGKPVVATGDVHFLRKEDEIIRKILLAGQGFEDFDLQAPLYLKTTDEMLEDFSYFGERAKEFVIDNPNKIADMVDGDVIPVPDGNYPPVIEGSDELLHKICWDRAMNIYGENGVIPKIVSERLDEEVSSIIKNGYSIMYVTAQKLVAYSEEHGYLVGSRGSVGSSFAATMAGISEVNPLPPHYVCPKCRHSEFFDDGSVGSGFDLPEKKCPVCGAEYLRDGHDIPFATFLGFKGDKVPDIDLNFSDEFQNDVQKYTETLFGSENVFKAGTISTIAEKTAFGFAKAYAEKKGIVLSNAELGRLASLVEGSKIKQTTGQHPAGMVVVPRDKEIYDFCPVQHPADDVNTDIVTTHFDFHSIHDTILKLDELGHVVPTTYKYLEEYSGISVNDISMSDPAVYSLFVSTEALGVTPEQIDSKTGTFCIPEFGTKFVRDMLVDCKPKNFADLLQISGLSHGTDVWLGNAKDLIDKGICTISEVIGTRDNIMMYLIHKGMDRSRAFKITETVRKGLVAKGKVSPEEWGQMEDDMRAVGVPEWYIDSCHKIKYMFPKAHAAAYVISALRLCWYKVHRPLEFYCAYFTARPDDVDVPTILKGKQAVKDYMAMIKMKGRDAAKKELDVFNNMLIFNEMMERGIEILPIDLRKSHAVKYIPENGKMRLPFGALSGVGTNAAVAVYEAAQKGDFLSKEEFQIEAGVSKTVIEALKNVGALDELPDTNQMTLF